VRFRVLGPLVVGDGDAPVTAARDRALLAMLLLRAGRVVPVDDLIDAMWDERPPATARGQLQSCVSRLRRTLAAAGIPDDAIVTDPAGYLVRVEPGEFDAAAFEQAVARAREAASAGRWVESRDGYRVALALWRGPALSGIASRAVQRGAAILDEQRLRAAEDRFDIELRLGTAPELVSELSELVDQHPLRERLRAQLMLALYRAGRPADALTEYERARQTLDGELGVPPGPALRDLHRRVLANDPALAEPPRSAPSPARCLPRGLADFTGRSDLVSRLVEAARIAPEKPVMHVIDGMAGSGKTSLAVHVAHLLASAYPDAQLFVDLHGHSERDPLEAATALVTLLRQLGVPGERIPAELDDRVALWRSELARRRAVVVLDNAASTAQVAPLLPATAHCLTLVTSRRRLVGLDGAQPESMPLLSAREGVDLLARVAGDRVHAEPDAAAEVVRRCGYLPLAIRLAAARLAHRPGWRVAHLASRLGTERPVLPELVAEDRTVVSAFALSYGQLGEPAQRVFRLLGLYPGEQFDATAAAALAGVPLPAARDVLDELVDRHLVDEPAAGRFRLHDLIREYASDLAAATEPEGERHAAVDRLCDHYLHAASAAGRSLMSPSARGLAAGEPQRPDLLEGTELSWLEAERANLAVLVHLAARAGHEDYAWRIAGTVWRFYFLRGYSDHLMDSLRDGLMAADRLGDGDAAATMHNYLAAGCFRTDRAQEAIEHLRAALVLRERAGDLRGVGISVANLGVTYTQLGRLDEAESYLRRAMDIWRRFRADQGVAFPLAELGLVAMLRGRYAEALRCHRRHLLFYAERHVDFQVGAALGNLGQVRIRLGQYAIARRLLTAAVRIHRRTENRSGEAEARSGLGVAARELGRLDEAERLHREAVAIMQGIGERRGEAAIRNDLAVTLAVKGDREQAVAEHRAAHAIATQVTSPCEQARALDGLAACLRDKDPDQARRHSNRALAIYRQTGVYRGRGGWIRD
jgi:DNA-binding SARP family transcriptional activator/Flp pilus assembly protein TadD